MSRARKTHGMTHHGAYRSWTGMSQRCYNEKDRKYPHYGARGITVCEEWRSSFEAFWADMGAGWFPRATIERDDFNGNYEPSNCRWVTRAEQSKNRRGVAVIDTPWGRMGLPQAAVKVGMSHPAFWRRYRMGLRGSALFAPPAEKGTRVRPLTREYLASLAA